MSGTKAVTLYWTRLLPVQSDVVKSSDDAIQSQILTIIEAPSVHFQYVAPNTISSESRFTSDLVLRDLIAPDKPGWPRPRRRNISPLARISTAERLAQMSQDRAALEQEERASEFIHSLQGSALGGRSFFWTQAHSEGDLSYRQIPAPWSPSPPDTRATTRKEDDIMVRAAGNHTRQTDALGNQMYQAKWGSADRRVSKLEAIVGVRLESAQIIADGRRDRERYMQGPLLELIATAPDEEIRQLHLRTLHNYRRWQREDELEDEWRGAQVAAVQSASRA